MPTITSRLLHALAKAPAMIGCLVNRHRPSGHKANWNGAHYVSRCEHCHRPIRRLSQGKWVSDTSVTPHLRRMPAPAPSPKFADELVAQPGLSPAPRPAPAAAPAPAPAPVRAPAPLH